MGHGNLKPSTWAVSGVEGAAVAMEHRVAGQAMTGWKLDCTIGDIKTSSNLSSGFWT